MNTPSNDESFLSVAKHPNIKYRPMPDPLSVYVPFDSLTEATVRSLIKTVYQPDGRSSLSSRRTLLAFLLAIHNKVCEFESDHSTVFDGKTLNQVENVRRWLSQEDPSGKAVQLDWTTLNEKYQKMRQVTGGGADHYHYDKETELYYGLTMSTDHIDVIQSREYMQRFRSHGWDPKELKVYWNVEQIENLCSKSESQNEHLEPKAEEQSDTKNEGKPGIVQITDNATNIGVKYEESEHAEMKRVNVTNNDSAEKSSKQGKKTKSEVRVETQHQAKGGLKGTSSIENIKVDQNADKSSEAVKGYEPIPSHDPSDADAVEALRLHPVATRNNAGKIDYINQGIEMAVFDVPKDAQIIVLNFANERSPGGGYLRYCQAQEEVILYNSDGYRALLDLKYGRMGGGYAIPEFGLAYVRDIRFFDAASEKHRKADMLVSACYNLWGSPQLYDNPQTFEEWKQNTKAKFLAFMAAAVANTRGDGSNTYLLLGPIGTGAFGNKVEDIGHIFKEVLSSKLMGSTGPIMKVFEHIWFVSIDQWKNDLFKEIFSSIETT